MVALIAGLLVAAASLASAAVPQRPTMPLFTATEIPAVCDAGLLRVRGALADLEALPIAKSSVQSLLHPLNRMQIALEDVESPIYMLSNVSPDKAVRDAAEACLLKLNEFDTDWLQSEKLYQRVQKVRVVNATGRKLKKDLLEAFEDTGVALPPPKRTRMKEIIQKLEEARQEFERNVRDNKTKLTFTPDQMRGLPAAYLEKAKRDDKGNYVLGFEYPEYFPFVASADDEEARRRYQFEFTNRGTPRNMEVLAQVVDLRREMAGLFGMKSYAQFSLRRKMARDPQTVRKFLDDVKGQVREVAAKDVEELRALKAQLLGTPLAEVTINNWDGAYYREKLRKVRTMAGNYQLIFMMPWLLLPFANPIFLQYFSHKVLRLLAPFAMLALLALNALLVPESVFYSALMFAQVLCYTLVLAAQRSASLRRWRVAKLGSAFLLLNWYAVLGLVRFLFDRDAHLWKVSPTKAAEQVNG